MKKSAVVMAGGKGARLWPYSTPQCPKQYLKLHDDESLLEKTLSRSATVVDKDHLFVVSDKAQEGLLQKTIGHMSSPQQWVFEPEGKNTGPAIFWAITSLLKRRAISRDSMVAVLPSDHLVLDPGAWARAMQEAFEASFQARAIATLGVAPTSPHTGYGYIKKRPHSLEVEEFREKPGLKKAQEYVASGQYYWNAGIFVAEAQVFLREFDQHCPEYGSHPYEQLEAVSFDCAVMEKCQRALVIEAHCQWSDLGSWEAFEAFLPHKEGNTFIRSPHGIVSQSSGNIVFSPHQEVSLIGVDGLVVVNTPDHLAVMKKGLAEKIKGLLS